MPKVNGCPINCIEYIAVSVQTKVSCLARMAPTIPEPEESLKDPAVLVFRGSHSVAFSWSLQQINIGSEALVLLLLELIGSAPKQIICLSISDTSTCSATVGV